MKQPYSTENCKIQQRIAKIDSQKFSFHTEIVELAVTQLMPTNLIILKHIFPSKLHNLTQTFNFSVFFSGHVKITVVIGVVKRAVILFIT